MNEPTTNDVPEQTVLFTVTASASGVVTTPDTEEETD